MEGEAVQGSVRFPGGGYKTVLALHSPSNLIATACAAQHPSIPSTSTVTLALGMPCSLGFVESESALFSWRIRNWEIQRSFGSGGKRHRAAAGSLKAAIQEVTVKVLDYPHCSHDALQAREREGGGTQHVRHSHIHFSVSKPNFFVCWTRAVYRCWKGRLGISTRTRTAWYFPNFILTETMHEDSSFP